MKEFCPKCGSEEGPFIGGFCEKCYLEDHVLIEVPEVFEVERCAKCSKIRIFGKWVEQSEKNLLEFFGKKVKTKEVFNPSMKIELRQKSGGEFGVLIGVEGDVSGQRIKICRTAVLKFRNVSCPSCGRLAAGYFEAKIQVRFEGERDEGLENRVYFELKRALHAQGKQDSLARITKREEMPTGLDLYIGSVKAARAAIPIVRRKFRAKIITSKKLVGRTNSGKNRFQFTYSLRF